MAPVQIEYFRLRRHPLIQRPAPASAPLLKHKIHLAVFDQDRKSIVREIGGDELLAGDLWAG